MKKHVRKSAKCAEKRPRNGETKLTDDQLTYINIGIIASHMQLLLEQYVWSEYWCDKPLLKLVKDIDKKLIRLASMAEKRANVEYEE